MESTTDRQDFSDHSSQQIPIFSPADLFEFIIDYWYILVITTLVCLGATWIYLRTVIPTYEHKMVIMLKNEKGSGHVLSELGGLNDSYFDNDIDNELFILKSKKLMSEVVDRLHLDVSYEAEGVLHTTILYGWSPVLVYFLDNYNGNIEMFITPISNERFKIEKVTHNGKKVKIPGTYPFGTTLRTKFGCIMVTSNPESIPSHINKPTTVKRISKEAAAAKYADRIKTGMQSGSSSLVKLSCRGEDTGLIDAILMTLVDAYNDAMIADRTRVAMNSTKFIDERIEALSNELGEVEEQLTSYQQTNLVLSNSAGGSQSLAYSQNTTKQLETDLYIAKGIRSYLAKTTNNLKLVPNVSGVGDANIQGQINAYNELLLQRERLLAESGERNTVVQNLTKQIDDMRNIISGSMDNYISNIQLQIRNSRRDESRALTTLRAIPHQEKKAQSILRKQSIKESLYTYLLSKREENAIQAAAMQSNLRVIETPGGSNAPVSPSRSSYFIVATLIGTLVPILVKIILILINTKVRGEGDIQAYTTLSVLGEIPVGDKSLSETIIDYENPEQDIISEAFRLLRSNIRFAYKDAQVLVLSSTMPGEGKSFISRNLAGVLAKAGKKVLLIDADLRRRSLSHFMDKRRMVGLSSYLSGLSEDIHSLLLKDMPVTGVDFIPAGPTPPNSSELLINESFDNLIADMRKQYDYIILDSVPAMSLSDAVEVNRLADMTLYVINVQKLNRRMLSHVESLNRQHKLKRMYAVLNDCKMTKPYKYKYYHYSGGRKDLIEGVADE